MKNAFMIAATGSGCGKTTITCALLENLRSRGIKAGSFKCGPDYIDPIFHKEIIGIPSKNLDLFFSGDREVEEIFLMDNDSEVSIVEGVMGLYDGINVKSDEGSSYHLANSLDIPIILIVNAHGMGRSIISVIKGFLADDSKGRIKGVILNQISENFYNSIRDLIEKETGIKTFGYFPKDKGLSVESRYLGLVLPTEIDDIKARLKKASDQVDKSIDIEGILENTKVSKEGISSKKIYKEKVRIAVARDKAFCFYYEDNFRVLREEGAKLIFFSPLEDERLPENIDGIVIGGGYPEKYLDKLSDNKNLMKEIKEAISSGMPSLAECGGFMYLHRFIYDENEVPYEMCNVIDGECRKTERLVRFGYVNITGNDGGLLNKNLIKGHEFHYYDSSNNGSDCLSTKPITGKAWESSHMDNKHLWGFAHLYYPSNRDFVKNFVSAAYEYSINGNV